MSLRRFALPVLALALAASSQAADFFGDFSTTLNNGSNGWVLGYFDNTGANFTAFSTFTNPGSDGIARWSNPANEVYLVPAAFKNTTGSTVHGIAPGEAALHGGQNGEMAVARYTVGSAGKYSISALFGKGDFTSQYGNVDVSVLVNGISKFSILNTGVGQSYNGLLTLGAGSTIDFVVGIGQDTFYNDSTPLKASITAVPGPEALAVFGLGMVAKLRRRKR